MKFITLKDLDYLEIGSAIVGSGGGGDPTADKMIAQRQLELYGPVKLLSVDQLKEDDVVVPVGFMGAPCVGIEKLPTGKEFFNIIQAIEKLFQKKVTALMAGEIGGSNAFAPLFIAGKLGLPVLDADGVGRAFPELQMSSFNLRNINIAPAFLSDAHGNCTILEETDPLTMEKMARNITISFGSNAALAFYIMSGKQAQEAVVAGSVSNAINLGRIVVEAEQNGLDPVQELVNASHGFILGSGIIEDIVQKVDQGFLTGTVTITNAERGQTLIIEYQNENLVAISNQKVLASTPDIIIPVDSQTGRAVTTEMLCYGARVTVIAIPSQPCWTDQKGLSLVGPRYFGYDFDYAPVFERLKELI